MNNSENYIAEKGIAIAEELDRLLSQTEEDNIEAVHIIELIEENPEVAKNLLERFEEKSKILELSHIINDDGKKLRYDKFMKHTQKYLFNRKLKRLVVASSIAAAIVCVTMLVMYFNNNESINTEDSLVYALQIEKPTIISGGDNIIEIDDKLLMSRLDSVNITKRGEQLIYGAQDSRTSTESVRIDELIIPKQYTYTVVLEDSSEIIVNAGSRLKYPNRFDGDDRVVELTGEAYFKVAKNNRPFIVKANGVEVYVYGTEFNVNTNIDGFIETVLVSGAVGVMAKGDDEVTHLKPSQLYSYNIEKGLATVNNVCTLEYTEWRDGYITCNEQSLSRLIDMISKWYDIEIDITDNDILEREVTVRLNADSELLMVISVLQEIADIELIRVDERKFIKN